MKGSKLSEGVTFALLDEIAASLVTGPTRQLFRRGPVSAVLSGEYLYVGTGSVEQGFASYTAVKVGARVTQSSILSALIVGLTFPSPSVT